MKVRRPVAAGLCILTLAADAVEERGMKWATTRGFRTFDERQALGARTCGCCEQARLRIDLRKRDAARRVQLLRRPPRGVSDVVNPDR